MAIDDFDLDEEDAMRECVFPKEEPPDFQRIAGHPLVSHGIPPKLWGQMWALIQLNTEGYFAEQDDRMVTGKDHEDYALYIRPSIKRCRKDIADGFRCLGITEEVDCIIEESIESLNELQSDMRLLAKISEGSKPSVSYSRAYELPLDPERQRQSIILLEEILIFRRHMEWLTDLSKLATDPRGPVWVKNQQRTAERYDIKQLKPAIAQDRRRQHMVTLLQLYLGISEMSASVTVDELIEESYPERFPSDQPSNKRTRALWKYLQREQQEEYRKQKEFDAYLQSLR